MKEFYYRGQRKDTGEWVFGFYFNIQDREHYISVPCVMGNCHIEVIPETVTMFFGLHDVNGKDVFVDDILCDKYEDEYEEGGFCYCYNRVAFVGGAFGVIGEITGELIPFSEYPISSQYVAGNVFENSELIKE